MREFLIRLSRLALFFAICWIVFWLPEFCPGISKPVAYIACALIALIGVTLVFFAKIDDEWYAGWMPKDMNHPEEEETGKIQRFFKFDFNKPLYEKEFELDKSKLQPLYE